MNDSWTFQKTIDNNNDNSSNNNNFSTIRRTLDTENNNSFTFGDSGMRQQSGYGPMRGQSQFRTRGGRQSNNNNNFNRFGNNNNNNDYDNDYDDDYDNYDDDDNNGNDNDMDNNMGFGNNNNNNNNNGWNNNGPSNNRRWIPKRGNNNNNNSNNNNNNFSTFGNNNNSNDFYERKQQQGVGGTRSQSICQNITQYMKELGSALESESDSKMCEMLSFRHYTRNDITRIVGNVSPRMIDTLGNQYLSKNNVSFQWKEILKCNIIAQKYSNQFDIFEKQRLRKMENRLNNSNNSNNNNNNSNDKADNGGMSENDEALVVDQKHPLHQAYSSLQSMMEKIEIMIKADSICSKANNNSNNNNNNSRRSADENNRVWYSRCLKVLTTFWVNTTIKLHYLYVEDTNNQRDVDMSNGGGNSNSNNNNNEDDSSEDYLQKSFLTGIQIFNAMDNEIDELLRMSNKSSNNNNMARGGIYHGLYYMANIIIRLSEVKNAPTYISDVIKATKKLDDSEYPYSDVVTTQYYYASYSIKNDKLDDAIIALQKAFNASRSAKYGGNAAFRNKVRILILYIPVKLTFAQFPKPQYLKKYGLYDHFWPIVVALRTGNLLLFESCMQYYSKDFISKDCYLLIDRLRLLVFVQLIRNIYKTQCNAENDNLTLPQGKGSEVIWFDTIQYANRLMNNEYFQSQFYKQFEYTYSKNEMKKIESFLNTNDNSNNNDNNNNNKSKNKENDVSNKIEETTLTLDEIAALCSTVVFKSLVKGYVAPKRCLVLSKKFYPFTRPQDAKLKNNQNKKWYEWEF